MAIKAWKIRSAHLRAAANTEPDGATCWGNGCEVRKCLAGSTERKFSRECCAEHAAQVEPSDEKAARA
jgi:hypothetical protein